MQVCAGLMNAFLLKLSSPDRPDFPFEHSPVRADIKAEAYSSIAGLFESLCAASKLRLSAIEV
jgi:hypothetical protein